MTHWTINDCVKEYMYMYIRIASDSMLSTCTPTYVTLLLIIIKGKKKSKDNVHKSAVGSSDYTSNIAMK